MNNPEQSLLIRQADIELTEIGISLLLYNGSMETVPAEMATEYTAFVYDNSDVKKTMYSGKIPVKKPFSKDLVLERIAKEDGRSYIDFAKIFEKLRTPGLRFSTTTYGLSVWVLFDHKNQMVNIKRIKEFLKQHCIEFNECYSDARWVYQFHISKKAENLSRVLNLSKS